MSGIDQVRAILLGAAADGPPRARHVAFDQPVDGAAAIAAEIDRTVLPRRLEARFDAGTVLAMEVSGRRLLRVLPPAPEALGPAHDAVFGAVQLGPDQAQPLAAMLMALCEGRRDVQLVGAPIPEGAEGGLSARRLRAALGLPETDAGEDTEAMQTLVTELGPHLSGALWIDDDGVTVLQGDDIQAERLSSWAAGMLDRLLAPAFPLAGALETDGIMVFALPDEARAHAVIAGRLGQFLVASVAEADPADTVALWRKTKART